MKVRVNAEACGNPMECRLCLERCRAGVFGTHPRTRRGPGVAAGRWIIDVIFQSQCKGCMECVKFCPRGAITVR